MKIQFALAIALFALVPVAAPAETQEEQQACIDDAFNVCGDAIPDRERVAACLARNIGRISVACRTVMMRYQKPTVVPISTTAPMSIRPKVKKIHARPGRPRPAH